MAGKKKARPKNKESLPATPRKKPAGKAKKQKVPRPYNDGTMTSAGFWGMLKSALRAKSRYWKPAMKVKLAARRDYLGPNARQRFEYQCRKCKLYFPEKEVQVDHIVPVGSLQCSADLEGVVARLFCDEDGFQVLCSECHAAKTKLDLVEIKETRKNKNA